MVKNLRVVFRCKMIQQGNTPMLINALKCVFFLSNVAARFSLHCTPEIGKPGTSEKTKSRKANQISKRRIRIICAMKKSYKRVFLHFIVFILKGKHFEKIQPILGVKYWMYIFAGFFCFLSTVFLFDLTPNGADHRAKINTSVYFYNFCVTADDLWICFNLLAFPANQVKSSCPIFVNVHKSSKG